ncbi:MAG: glutamyl-tRNA reductase [Oscillospiraceae bacterium]
MNLLMSGLDYSLAPIALREKLAFTKSQAGEVAAALRERFPGVLGCAIISTCNRTELYLSCCEGLQLNPGEALCIAVGQDYSPYAHAFVLRKGEPAARHLMEVACGLCSQIWGEDQIVAQVKTAIATAREFGTAVAVLETLFRTAVSAAKSVKTGLHLSAIPTSAAAQAVEVLGQRAGSLDGKKALIIGNGEMGRLAASLLREAGCAVTVTLRTYRHGETVVPCGCSVVPYEGRYEAMEQSDLLLSATTSPHYTVTTQELAALRRVPPLLADLAIPRDIQPECGRLPGVTLLNMDDLGVTAVREIPVQVAEILEQHMERFRQWADYRAYLPVLEQLKETITGRVLEGDCAAMDSEELAEYAVGRAVELLAGGMKEKLNATDLLRCEEKIRTHNGGRADTEKGEEVVAFSAVC